MDEASSSCPMSSSSAQGTGCPVAHEQIDPRNQMAAQPNQNPSPGQRYPLPTDRRKSSIPRSSTGGSGTAEGNKGRGEEKEEEVWLYPSPQMFYNAMRRKGWDPREEDMTTVVGIHNAVNERTWNQVLEWERLHQSECPHPRLARFRGRPHDLSPKARMKGWIGYKPPFDRHDWIVDRCGTEVRYIIDFYQGEAPKDNPAAPAFHLDVRPALDSAGNVYDRIRMGLKSALKED